MWRRLTWTTQKPPNNSSPAIERFTNLLAVPRLLMALTLSRISVYSASRFIEHLAAHETARSLGDEICQKRKHYSALIEPKKKENPVLRKRASSCVKKCTTRAVASTK
jgi:hypothetical protein